MKVTETGPGRAPMRDRFSQRWVLIVVGIVVLMITAVACVQWLRGQAVTEIQDRWWIAVVSFFIGTLTTTAAHIPVKKDDNS